MSDLNTSENVGGAPLPPTRNRTKPTVIRPASKTSDTVHPQQAPPRPAPPGSRPPPPSPAAAQKQNNETKASKAESHDQHPLSHRSSINGPTSTLNAKPGSVKKKLEITIVDARPMSEAGFRGLKGDATSPTVVNPVQSGNNSEKSELKPEITRKVDQDGPPKPNRISISRPAANEGEIAPPAKPSRPAVVASIHVEDTDATLDSKDNVVPPKPMRPTIIRPQSHFQKPTDQKSSETAVNPQPSQQLPTLPPSRPKPPHVLPAAIETPKLSPTPRPRSSVISPPEEIKAAPVPSPRPIQRNVKATPAKPETSTHQAGTQLSQKNDASPVDNGLLEPKSSQQEPPQRPKRPSTQPKPNINSKQADDYTDTGPLYAKIVKPSSSIKNHESSVEEVSESKPEPGAQFRVKLRSTTSVEDSGPGGVENVNQRASQSISLPKPAPKPKPLNRADSGKTKSPESGLPLENVLSESSAEVQIRPKSNAPVNMTCGGEVKPGHISEHFLTKFEQSSDDPPSGPPLPSRRPVTIIGGPQRNQASTASTVKTEDKVIDSVVEKPESKENLPKKSSTSESIKNLQDTTVEAVDVKKPQRPAGPPHPDGGTHPGSSSQPRPSVDLPVKQQPSFSDDKKQKEKVPSNLPHKEKPERPASMALPKPARPTLPIRPRPGHPLYHYMSKEPHGIAVHDYTARHKDELSFKVGETVLLLKKEDEHWYFGKVGSKEGLFPANYVNVKCSLPDENLKADRVNAKASDAVDSELDLVKGPRCRARFDFEGEGDNDLALEDGDVVQIIERVGTEWLRGEHRGRRGIFPVSFVEIIEDLQPSKDAANMQVTAIADFTGQDGELSFYAGDTINVLSQVNDEWLQGEFQGKKGRFPASFVSHIPINLPEYRPYKKPQGKAAGASSQGKQPDVELPDQKSSAQSQEADELINEGPALLQLSKQTVLGYCRGRFDYLDPPLGDLAFKAGDRIEILEFFGEDWAKGRLGKKEGMIPLNLVAEEIIEPDIIVEPEVKEILYGKVVHDFQGESEHDLTIKEGDVIEMEEIADTKGNWRWGRLNGKRGMFPVLFVEVIPNQK